MAARKIKTNGFNILPDSVDLPSVNTVDCSPAARGVGRCKILGRPGQEMYPFIFSLHIFCAAKSYVTKEKIHRKHKHILQSAAHKTRYIIYQSSRVNFQFSSFYTFFFNYWGCQGGQRPCFTHSLQIIGAMPMPTAIQIGCCGDNI